MDKQVYFDKKLKAASTFLSRWQEANAKVWEYQLSHTHITIRLERAGVKGNLHIVCIDPIYYKGPFKWSNSELKLELEDDIFILRDERNFLEIRCYEVEIKENCKPIF